MSTRRRPGLSKNNACFVVRDALATHESQKNGDDTLFGLLLPMTPGTSSAGPLGNMTSDKGVMGGPVPRV
jgi:hypothetical protein